MPYNRILVDGKQADASFLTSKEFKDNENLIALVGTSLPDQNTFYVFLSTKTISTWSAGSDIATRIERLNRITKQFQDKIGDASFLKHFQMLLAARRKAVTEFADFSKRMGLDGLEDHHNDDARAFEDANFLAGWIPLNMPFLNLADYNFDQKISSLITPKSITLYERAFYEGRTLMISGPTKILDLNEYGFDNVTSSILPI